MALSAIITMYANKISKSHYVVHDKRGELVSPNNFSKGLNAVLDLAGIKLPSGTNVHALRHTFASMCFAAKLPIRTISELLGHSSVQITMDTYIHLIQENGVIHVPELVNLK
jgi:integrase